MIKCRHSQNSSGNQEGYPLGFHQFLLKFKRVPLRISIVFLRLWLILKWFNCRRSKNSLRNEKGCPLGFHQFLSKIKTVPLRISMVFCWIWLMFTWFNCKYSSNSLRNQMGDPLEFLQFLVKFKGVPLQNLNGSLLGISLISCEIQLGVPLRMSMVFSWI